MIRLALMMLIGDRKKFVGMVLGVAFSAGLIAFQMSSYCAVMKRTHSIIRDTHGRGIWVMDPATLNADAIRPLTANDLHRVRGVPGVTWAVPFYKDLAYAEPGNGRFFHIVLLGLDDSTLTGLPHGMALGRFEDLAVPDAVVVDELGYASLWPGEPFRIGRTFEIDDRRAVLVGICRSSPPFMTMPVVYTRYRNVRNFVAAERQPVSFILAGAEAGVGQGRLCGRIEQRTGLRAMTGKAFFWRTIRYYFEETGIPINFCITVGVGFVVGIAFAGQMFYLVTLENLRHFAALKAVGTRDATLVEMVLLQAMTSGLLGYGIGMGLTALLFGTLMRTMTHLAGFYLMWQVMAVAAGAVFCIMLASGLLSIRRVLRLEAATMLRG